MKKKTAFRLDDIHGYRKKTRYILRYRKCDLDDTHTHIHMPPVGNH